MENLYHEVFRILDLAPERRIERAGCFLGSERRTAERAREIVNGGRWDSIGDSS
jgi:hypothetical protein